MTGVESVWAVLRVGATSELWRVYWSGNVSSFVRDGEEDATPRDVAERFVREFEEDGGRPGAFVVVELAPVEVTR